MSKEFLILHGPNLNLLGTREPEIYGSETLPELVESIKQYADKLDIGIRDFQSNVEGELVNALHEAKDWAAGVIFNAGAYTHTSVALRDAITSTELDVVEVHMSNIHTREDFRHVSMISAVCVGSIAGFGRKGYFLAVDALADIER